MTSRSVPASEPANSLREVPEEWLELYIVILSEEPDDDVDAAFAKQIQAIYRMHEIDVSGGVNPYRCIESVRAARIELDRRRGVKPRAPELMSRSDAVATVRRCLECQQWAARMYLDMIPALNDRGEPPWYGQRRWHRLADVQALLNSTAS